MMKNGMGSLELNQNKFVEMPKKCNNNLCGKTLKNKKMYIMTRVIRRKSGYWTVGKQCKRCGFESASTTGDE